MKNVKVSVSIPHNHLQAIIRSGQRPSAVIHTALMEHFEANPKRYTILPIPEFPVSVRMGPRNVENQNRFKLWCEEYKAATGEYPPERIAAEFEWVWRRAPEI